MAPSVWLKPLLSLLLFAAALPATAQPAASVPNNPEMEAIYASDQAPRSEGGATVNWSLVGPEDRARRARTRTLLDSGALRTADDFYNASVIFQHGESAADYMLAHTLAVIAAARGRHDAAWMAAASLDRYLQEVGRPQIYGTQFHTPDRLNTTQEPFDRTLISDALRQALDVPTMAEQEVRRQDIQARYRAAPRR